MFREQYTELNNQIIPDQDLINSTLYRIKVYNRNQKGKADVWQKPKLIFTSLFLCIFLSMPVLAANVEPVYRLMYYLSPAVAQFFKPVQKSDEDNGIKMEVVSAYIHENIAEIYITMQDLTNDRIDESIDLFDSYAIHRPFSSVGRCDLVGYDANTKTATFLITIEEYGNKNISGDKITFSVHKFISHKQKYEDILIPIDLSTVLAAKETQKVHSIGGGGEDYEKYISSDNKTLALIPSMPLKEFPVEGISMTGIAFVNNYLHIQTAVKDPLSNDNHGYFYLKDKTGKIINSNCSFNFTNQSEGSERINYCNEVFAIDLSKISEYTLYGYFVISGEMTEGNWEVTFPLDSEKE